MKNSLLIKSGLILVTLTCYFDALATQDAEQSKEVYVVKENQKAFLANDLDKYVVYDLMSDGSMVYKDTLNFNEYRDKALFTLTQNQTILNRQIWANTALLVVVLVLLIYVLKRK